MRKVWETESFTVVGGQSVPSLDYSRTQEGNESGLVKYH